MIFWIKTLNSSHSNFNVYKSHFLSKIFVLSSQKGIRLIIEPAYLSQTYSIVLASVKEKQADHTNSCSHIFFFSFFSAERNQHKGFHRAWFSHLVYEFTMKSFSISFQVIHFEWWLMNAPQNFNLQSFQYPKNHRLLTFKLMSNGIMRDYLYWRELCQFFFASFCIISFITSKIGQRQFRITPVCQPCPCEYSYLCKSNS